MSGPGWTREQDDQLRALWATGLSAAKIGDAMGITKNSVVGRAHRMELSARPSPLKRDYVPKAGRRASKVPQAAAPRLVAQTPAPRASAAPAAMLRLVSSTPPAPKPRPSGTCLWPMWGDREAPTHEYCCAPRFAGVWCAQHHARGTQKPVRWA